MMNRKKYLLVLTFLGFLSVVTGFASLTKAPATIDNISIQSGMLNTKVILESDSPLSIISSQYLQEKPATLAVDVDESLTDRELKINFHKSSLVKNVNMQKGENDCLRLLIEMKEKVPYRIYSGTSGTIIELNKYQNGQPDNMLDSSLRDKINNQPTPSIYLKDISISEQPDQIIFTANLTKTAVPHVFVLNNPLRLVVDLYNTLYSHKPSNYPVHKLGVQNVRAAQFQVSDPDTIARMVFDLEEPGLFAINSQNEQLEVSFFQKPGLDFIPKAAPLIQEEFKTEVPEVELTETRSETIESEKSVQTKIEAEDLTFSKDIEQSRIICLPF